jgi:hypothetical protein
MKIADKKYFLVFLLFVSMLSPSCNRDEKKTVIVKERLAPKKAKLI